MTAQKTIGALLKTSTDRLKPISESPALDARLLLAHVIGVEAQRLPLMTEDAVSDNSREHFGGLIERRLEGEPVAYIIGHQEFWSLRFLVNRHTLIPRGDTETLIEAILKERGDEPQAILDLGTGSGAIACALLSERPGWHGVATDISGDALSCAQENAQKLGLADRLFFSQGSWFNALDEQQQSFDIIISNPPYIKTDVIKTLSKDVRDFEPHHALDGGQEGLDAYFMILREAKNYLKSTGLLAFEIGYDQAKTVGDLVSFHFQNMKILKDLADKPRCILASDGPITR